jgi:hypothetical protein
MLKALSPNRAQIYVSADGIHFGVPVAKGIWNDDQTDKPVTFDSAMRAKAVRLTSLTEAGKRGPWSSMAEINLMGTVTTLSPPAPPPPPPVLPRKGWFVSATSSENIKANTSDAADVSCASQATGTFHERIAVASSVQRGHQRVVHGVQVLHRLCLAPASFATALPVPVWHALATDLLLVLRLLRVRTVLVHRPRVVCFAACLLLSRHLLWPLP